MACAKCAQQRSKLKSAVKNRQYGQAVKVAIKGIRIMTGKHAGEIVPHNNQGER